MAALMAFIALTVFFGVIAFFATLVILVVVSIFTTRKHLVG